MSFKISKSFLSSIILFSIIFSLFFVLPKKSEGASVVVDPTNLVQNTASAVADSSIAVKEFGLDAVAWYFANTIIKKMTQQTVNWVNNGFRGSPAYVTDPGQFFLDIGDTAASKFLSETSLNKLCTPFRAEVRLALVKNYLSETGGNYSCSLSILRNNYDQFMQDFSVGGWDGWFELTQINQNNPYGAYLDSRNELSVLVGTQQKKYENQLAWGRGFLSHQMCPENQEVTQAVLDDMAANNNEEWRNLAIGDCLVDPVTVTPGSVIEERLNHALGSGTRRIEAADEIDELISALLEQLISRVVGGIGRGLSGLSQDSGSGSFIDDLGDEPERSPSNPGNRLVCTTQPGTGINGIPPVTDCEMRTPSCIVNPDGSITMLEQRGGTIGRGLNLQQMTADLDECIRTLTTEESSAIIPDVVCTPDDDGVLFCEVDDGTYVPNNSGGSSGAHCDASLAIYAGVLMDAMNQVLSERPDVAALPNIESGGRQNARTFLALVETKLIEMGYNATDDVLNGNGNPNTGDLIAVWGSGDSAMERYDAINGSAATIGGAIQTDFTGSISLGCIPGGSTTSCACTTTSGGGGAQCSAGIGNSPGAPSSINESQIIWGDADIGGWPVTANLNVSASGNTINLNYDRANSWPSIFFPMFNGDPVVGNAWVVVWRNGAWHASTFEWLRPGQTQKGLENLLGADGTLVSPLGNFSPKTGELYGFVVSTPARGGNRGTVNERSNVVPMIWGANVCSPTSGGGGTNVGGGSTNPGSPVITSISPTSAISGQTIITIRGSSLTSTVQFFGSDGGRSTVTGTLNSSASQVTVQVPAGIPVGYATVRIYRDATTQSNGILLNITAMGSSGTLLPSTAPTSTWSPTQTINGWWPRLSTDGRYVAYGDWGESWVTDLQTGQNYDFRQPADLPVGGSCIAGQWINATTITFVCQSPDLPANHLYRYEVTVGEWTPRRTSDATALVASSEFVARDGNWATWLAGGNFQLVKNNAVVTTNSGGVLDISGTQMVHACDNGNSLLCLRNGTTLARTFLPQTPLHQATITGGYIVYGGYGGVRGITPAYNDVNLRLSTSFNEGGGRSAGIRIGSAAQVVLVNSTYWVATVAWPSGTNPSVAGNYIFLRPWGSNTAIVINANASSIDVRVVGTEFVIAYNDDRGRMSVIRVPTNATRISIP